MPNYCSNKLAIKGPKAALAKFAATLGEGGEFLLAQTYPIPEALTNTNISCGGCSVNGKVITVWRTVDGKPVEIPARELSSLKRKYGAINWYDWCIGHWGTKWDVPSEKEKLEAIEELKRLEFEEKRLQERKNNLKAKAGL